jgi:hypothetical protein
MQSLLAASKRVCMLARVCSSGSMNVLCHLLSPLSKRLLALRMAMMVCTAVGLVIELFPASAIWWHSATLLKMVSNGVSGSQGVSNFSVFMVISFDVRVLYAVMKYTRNAQAVTNLCLWCSRLPVLR